MGLPWLNMLLLLLLLLLLILLFIIITIIIIIIINCFTWKRPLTICKTKIKRDRLKAFRYLHAYKPQTHSAKTGRTVAGEEGCTFSLRKLPLKKDVTKTQANSYVAPCILAHVRFLHDLHPMQCSLTIKNKSYFLVQGTGAPNDSFL